VISLIMIGRAAIFHRYLWALEQLDFLSACRIVIECDHQEIRRIWKEHQQTMRYTERVAEAGIAPSLSPSRSRVMLLRAEGRGNSALNSAISRREFEMFFPFDPNPVSLWTLHHEGKVRRAEALRADRNRNENPPRRRCPPDVPHLQE
jgi:hypothetical protein